MLVTTNLHVSWCQVYNAWWDPALEADPGHNSELGRLQAAVADSDLVLVLDTDTRAGAGEHCAAAHSAALSNTPDPGPGPTRRAVLEPVLAAAGDKLGVVVVTRRPEDTAGAVLSVFADPDTVITQVEEWSVDSRASKIGPHERRFVITQKAPTRALSWLKGSRHEIGIPASAQLSEGRRN